MRRLQLLLLLMLVSFSASAQSPAKSDAEARIKRGIDFVYNLEFENADKAFNEIIQEQPNNPAGHFFLAMVDWWRILIDIDNEQYDDRFYDALDDVVEMCDDLLDQNPTDINALFFKGGSIGFKGRLKAHRSSWFDAANAGRKALPIVQEASELDPNNYDILLGSGIYNYYAEVIPNEYPFVKPLLLFVPPGDKTKGIQQITMAAEKGKYAAIESSYFLMQIYYQFERDYPKAMELAVKLHTRFPNNMLFHKYVGRCFVVTSQWEKMKETWQEISNRCQKKQRGYGAGTEREAEYYLGVYDMTMSMYEPALKHFYRCDELSREVDKDGPSGFMVLSNMKVGNIHDLQGKRDLALAQYRKVLDMKDYKDSHRQVQQFIDSPFRK
ncbi:MAG: tetratricopeptide repeat protein [Ignavibacteriae bacterium]|nr:tetratricopeptide repeat protein [Ignavibacteriota bacterium]